MGNYLEAVEAVNATKAAIHTSQDIGAFAIAAFTLVVLIFFCALISLVIRHQIKKWKNSQINILFWIFLSLGALAFFQIVPEVFNLVIVGQKTGIPILIKNVKTNTVFLIIGIIFFLSAYCHRNKNESTIIKKW